MGLFGALEIAGSGMTVHRKWLDAISDNLANINTVRPTSGEAFRQRYIVAQAVDYGSGQGGVTVGAVLYGDPQGRLVYNPEHPLADEGGYVRLPTINLGDQMTQLIMAQRGYQAQTATIERAQTAYNAALQLGKSA